MLTGSIQTCQSKDWKFAHSLECSIFQKLKPMVLPNNARALLRMVLRTGRSKYSTQELGIFSNLETHIREIQESQAQLDRVTLTARAIKDYSATDMSEESISGYAARVRIRPKLFHAISGVRPRLTPVCSWISILSI